MRALLLCRATSKKSGYGQALHHLDRPPTTAADRAPAPPRPRRATIERRAAIFALFNDPHERALLARISPLDITEMAARRLLAGGHLYAAAHLAAFAAPYRHRRTRVLTTEPAGFPIEPATPKLLVGFGGAEPEPPPPARNR